MTRYREFIRPVIHWFRKDLRLTDNLPLSSAAESGHPVLAVYILEYGDSNPWEPGVASRWWLHHSLKALDQSLKTLGNRLILRKLVTETGATGVYYTSLTEPHAIKVDSK